MILTAIAAIDRTGLIGDGTRMPWHLPRDLRRFRKLTLGKPVIMGRRTFESLPGALDGRLNIILTQNAAFHADGCQIARSIAEALSMAVEHASQTGANEAVIIGGSVVFEETVPLWDRLLLTVVEGAFEGSVFFPLDKLGQSRWRLVEQEQFGADGKNPHPHWFLKLERCPTDSPRSQDFSLLAWLQDSSGSSAAPLC